MTDTELNNPNWDMIGHLFRAHPWHGIPLSPEPNSIDIINAYIEILPTDTVKYELDKDTGLLNVDRPQRFSSVCPELYGLVPQTYCGEKAAAFSRNKTGRKGTVGDLDPLDICVLTDKHMSSSNIFMRVRPIGGFCMLDGDEADDKIIAVLDGDPSYGFWRDISQCPAMIIERLKHYFLSYKQSPDAKHPACEITHLYSAEEAKEVIRLTHEDYLDKFGDVAKQLSHLRSN